MLTNGIMATRRGSVSIGACTTSSQSSRRKPERIAADLAVTLVHEYAHALLHFDIEDEPERAKREVEAEAVAYIVGRYFGLDTSGSAFYLAAWQGEDPEAIQERLGRISSTAREIIGSLEE